MANRLPHFLLTMVVAAGMSIAGAAAADVLNYELHDHPGGNQAPPEYGFRFDNLLGPGTGKFTFSFDYADGSGTADVDMEIDEDMGTIHVFGRMYGGLDVGPGWDPANSGWADIDFTYRTNLLLADDIDGSPGNDFYITDQSPMNNGTFILDGWGGDLVTNLSDKSNGTRSFQFDNDVDPKGNQVLANDPTIYSASGWMMDNGMGGSAHDFIFIGEFMAPMAVETATWGSIKGLYR